MKPPTEIPLKVFLLEEAERRGVKPHAIHQRIRRGKYPHLKIRRVNSRVVFVTVP